MSKLDKLADSPVDIYVNNKLFGYSEVVVIDENFGVRIIDLVGEEPWQKKIESKTLRI